MLEALFGWFFRWRERRRIVREAFDYLAGRHYAQETLERMPDAVSVLETDLDRARTFGDYTKFDEAIADVLAEYNASLRVERAFSDTEPEAKRD